MKRGKRNNINVKIGEGGITGIRVESGIHFLFHQCCDCGCRHRVTFEWPRGAVVMKWEREDEMNRDEQTANKETGMEQDFTSDYNDPQRNWINLGGDIEGSYDGKRYVDIRNKGTKERCIFISLGALKKAISLFVPPPLAE